jgi:hypothetical protein
MSAARHTGGIPFLIIAQKKPGWRQARGSFRVPSHTFRLMMRRSDCRKRADAWSVLQRPGDAVLPVQVVGLAVHSSALTP